MAAAWAWANGRASLDFAFFGVARVSSTISSTTATAQLQRAHRQGDLDGSMSLAVADAEAKSAQVMYRAAAAGHDRAHDAGLGGSC